MKFVLFLLLIISTTVAVSLVIERQPTTCIIQDPFEELLP